MILYLEAPKIDCMCTIHCRSVCVRFNVITVRLDRRTCVCDRGEVVDRTILSVRVREEEHEGKEHKGKGKGEEEEEEEKRRSEINAMGRHAEYFFDRETTMVLQRARARKEARGKFRLASHQT